MIAYYGYVHREDTLRCSSSGGLAYQLAAEFIDDGYVYGVSYSNDYRSAIRKEANTLEELACFCGSKYIRASLKLNGSGTSAFQCVKERLLQGVKVLFFGLPCECAGLKNFLDGIDQGGLLCVDLICNGVMASSVQEQYIALLEEKYHSHVVSFNARYKKKSWGEPYIRAEFESGAVFCKPMTETEYGVAFNYSVSSSCPACQYKGEQHVSDLTIGDFWGIGEEEPGYNSMGVSIAIVHNRKGERALQTLHGFSLYQAEEETALIHNPAYYRPRNVTDKHRMFSEKLKAAGLRAAVRCMYTRYGWLLHKCPYKVKRAGSALVRKFVRRR